MKLNELEHFILESTSNLMNADLKGVGSSQIAGATELLSTRVGLGRGWTRSQQMVRS